MGDLPWCCGWGGGRGCAVHVGGWREGEGLAHPWEPRGGPRAGDVGESWSERLASGWKKGSPGTGAPPPAASFPDPRLGLCEGGSSSVPGAAAGTGSGLHRTLPLRSRWRRGSAAGQSVSPEVRPLPRLWSDVLRLARQAGLESATSPRGCCCSFEYATTSGRVTFLLAFAGKEIHVQRISVLIATPTLLKVFLQWECLLSYPGPFDGSHSSCRQI